MSDYQDYISTSADPELADTRFQQLQQNQNFQKSFSGINGENRKNVIHIIGLSDFLFRLICYKPKIIKNLELSPDFSISHLNKLRQVKEYKYAHLLKITAMDLGKETDYGNLLTYISDVADTSMQACLKLVIDDNNDACPFSVIAMGKLGARELNFSSDVDVLFTCSQENSKHLEGMSKTIRKLVRQLQKVSASGFLYRVDLNLRPWSKTGPMIMPVDDMENYYAISTEPLERFIWLRARVNAGDPEAGNDLIERLKPFVFKGSLGTDDLDRFVKIKNHMKAMHKKPGAWNVKMGRGGIRDIEFFIQLLQITNAAKFPELQITNTLEVMEKLVEHNFLQQKRADQIKNSYLFLRRLENHLQMVDEKQTHHLPEDPDKRLKIARSMGFIETDNKQNIKAFDEELEHHRQLSASCFEDVLPDGE